ncbi:alpha-amylase family glycosyl hydrolase [Flaviaesturariibacter amylovorans]|uniref:Alpha-amylase family glycosyl hydrolase n=1 Tax=Flaviaesturariibacter amylovorans TaxID=1084520 RepID=A0ABP8HUP7_9BACT
MRPLLSLLLLCSLSLSALAQSPVAPPSWILSGNIYEVNVRQYTPEGTFRAFEAHLPRLKNMGVQTLWFMPIHPISKKDRKGGLGSYYAIANYRGINPEFGTLADWKRLVNKAHSLGMKVIIDWVPNHTGGDHYWLTKHPDFYVKDPKTGEAVSPFDWTDVRKLNYSNPRMVDSMIATLKYWIRETGIDGYRCDVAGEVPKAFWSRCIRELRTVKPVFMLAESNEPWMHEVGFNATYAWEPFSIMKDIAAGKRSASALDSLLTREDTAFARNAMRLYFTSNHDENTWNKADYGTMPGSVHAPFAVLTFTMKKTLPLVYSGQEEPVMDSLSFFWKDTIGFRKYARAPFYKQLLTLRRTNPAMASDATFTRLATGNDNALFAFERRKGTGKVLVILNLSGKPQQLTWKQQPSQNVWMNVFGGLPEPVKNGFGIEPWGYAVYESR